MSYSKLLSIIVALGVFVSCKHQHNHEVSPELKQAYEIQKSALQQNAKMIDELKEAKLTLPVDLKDKHDQVLNNMIEIEGMEHDHKNCNHDHKRPTFQISDADMITVQSEWRDSLLSVNKLIKEFYNEKSMLIID